MKRSPIAGNLHGVVAGLAVFATALVTFLGCDGSNPEGLSAETAAKPAGTAPEAALATVRAAPRDSSFSIALPADLLTHAFAETLMATSADGSYRLFVEVRKIKLLEALGQLKDELIGLGWEVAEERHFEAATLLTLGQGAPRSRQERAVWLVQADPEHTLLCDGLARGYAVARLGPAHRSLCQTLTLSARSPQ